MRNKSIREAINEELEASFGVERARSIKKIKTRSRLGNNKTRAVRTNRVARLRRQLRGNLILRMSVLLTRRKIIQDEDVEFIADLKDDLTTLEIISEEEKEELPNDSVEALLNMALTKMDIDPRESRQVLSNLVDAREEPLPPVNERTIESLFPHEFIEGKIREDVKELLVDIGLTRHPYFKNVLLAWYPHAFYELPLNVHELVHVHRFTDVSKFLSVCLVLPSKIYSRSQLYLLRYLYEQGYNSNEILLMSRAGSIMSERFPSTTSHCIARFIQHQPFQSSNVFIHDLSIKIEVISEEDTPRILKIASNMSPRQFQAWLTQRWNLQPSELDKSSEVVKELQLLQAGELSEKKDREKLSKFLGHLITVVAHSDEKDDESTVMLQSRQPEPPRTDEFSNWMNARIQLQRELREVLARYRRENEQRLASSNEAPSNQQGATRRTADSSIEPPSSSITSESELPVPTEREQPESLGAPPPRLPDVLSTRRKNLILRVSKSKVESDPPIEKIIEQECPFNVLVVLFLQELLQEALNLDATN